jgi:ABC-type polysaccharide/polyol phosphate export permease
MTRAIESPGFEATAKRQGPAKVVRSAWADVWDRRRLIGYLTRADLKKKGADTFFGNLWWIIDPLLQMMVYVVLVDFIFHKSVPDYPLFIFCAILPWKWFTSSIYDSLTSVSSSYSLIKQVSFPKLILPVASTVAAVANFGFGLIAMLGLLILFYPHRATLYLAYIPVIAVVQFIFTMAMTVLVSSLNVFFRDIGNVARHALRLWFYLSPGLYSLQSIQDATSHSPVLSAAVALNPWTWIFSSYRNVIYEGVAPFGVHLLAIAGVSAVLLMASTLVFKRLEPAFAKVL